MVTNLQQKRHTVSHSHRPPASVISVTNTAPSRHEIIWRGQRPSHSLAPSRDEFPDFSQTGDVEILLSTSDGRHHQRYVLHSLILGQNSPYFRRLFMQDYCRAIAGPESTVQLHNDDERRIAAKVPSSSRISWHLQLDESAEPPILVENTDLYDSSKPPVPVASTRPQRSANGFTRTVNSLSALSLSNRPQPHPKSSVSCSDTLLDYENLFRTFYNYSPKLDTVDIAKSYSECKSLVHLADLYQALDVVGPRIDHHMLRFGTRLFKQIAKYPPSYLKLGYLAKSKTIFAESVKHVVGQWPMGRSQLEHALPKAVIDLIEDKADVLNETKARVDCKLFRLSGAKRSSTRASPAFTDWLAISMFRQWFADQTSPYPSAASEPSHHHRHSSTIGRTSRSLNLSRRRDSVQLPPAKVPAPQPDRAYFLLASDDYEAYLPHDELKRLLKSAPGGFYSRDNLKHLERAMDSIKDQARQIVRPLVKSELELDVERDLGAAGVLGYLTCTKVREQDFPWEG